MAFLLNKTSIASRFRSQPLNTEGAFSVPCRRLHVELGAREKALLAEDPSLMRFKSEKKAVRQIKRVWDVLAIIVIFGSFYEIYARTGMRGETREEAGGRE